MAKINMTPPTQTKARSSKLPADVMNAQSDILSSSTDTSSQPGSDKKPAGKPKDLNFKVDPNFHYQFKAYAFLNGMTMADLLTDVFMLYQNPDDPILKEIAIKRNSNIKK